MTKVLFNNKKRSTISRVSFLLNDDYFTITVLYCCTVFFLFFFFLLQDPYQDDDVRRNKECRLGVANVHAIKVHVENGNLALRR